MDALDMVPQQFQEGGTMEDDEPEMMKLGKGEIEMKSHVAATLGSGENEYRFTVPQKLEVNLFAGKKRIREQKDIEDDDSEEERRLK